MTQTANVEDRFANVLGGVAVLLLVGTAALATVDKDE